MTENPHFSQPFRFDGSRGAIVNEQDSEDEIFDCIKTILSYQIGQRPEKPEFGIQDPTFSMPIPSTSQLYQALATWEPRIVTEIARPIVDKLDPLVQEIKVGRVNPTNE